MTFNNYLFRLFLFSFLVLAALLPPAGQAKMLPLMRISVEYSASHLHTRAVERFARKLSVRTAGRLSVRFYSNAKLFRDLHVIKALSSGRVEMAVPGTWHIDPYAPNVGIFLLPAFYGRDGSANHRILAGPVGKALNRHVEQILQVKVVGRWIDLGHAHLYGISKEILVPGDIAGMKIRVPGGVINELRMEAMGATPVTIPWPDLPAKLARGAVDGILSAHESVRSAALWRLGVKSAFEDSGYFPQYIPLVRASFWRKLPADLKETIAETWEENVDRARREAAIAQRAARKILSENGITILTPTEEEIGRLRAEMLPAQAEIIRHCGIDNDLFQVAAMELADPASETGSME